MGCWFSHLSAKDEESDAVIVLTGSLLSNMMREAKNEDVFAKYEVLRVLGEGSMGAVSCVKVKEDRKGGVAFQKKKKEISRQKRLATTPSNKDDATKDEERDSDVRYALKTIQLNRVSPDFVEELRNEINILRTLDHPNIVRAFEVYEQQYKGQPRIHLILELCSGGDLYRRTPYSERDAAGIVGQLLSAVKYMHDHDIVHRDLKFENIMFESHRADAEIKVIDFGLSKKFLHNDTERYMSEGVGTIYTMAPQVLEGDYNSQADMWSVGVITYMLLSDTKPFSSRGREKMIDMIMRCDYHPMEGLGWDHVTQQAKDFCKALLQLDPAVRLDADQALQHDWMSGKLSLSERKPTSSLLEGVTNSLSQYRQTTALQRVARNVGDNEPANGSVLGVLSTSYTCFLFFEMPSHIASFRSQTHVQIIAHQASTDEIFQLRKVFEQFDVSRDGVINYEEFKQGLQSLNLSEETIKDIFQSVVRACVALAGQYKTFV
jgi:serine/threonine protein kinase